MENEEKSEKKYNVQNLIPASERSKSEVREFASRGGIASGETRRRQKTMREALRTLLSMPMKRGDVEKEISSLEDFKGKNVEVQTRILLSLIAKAANGDVKAAEFLRDTKGERPTETFEDLTPKSPMILGTISAELVAKAKADHEARQLENNQQ